MREKVKLEILEGEAVIKEGGDTTLGKILAGTKGEILIKSPLIKARKVKIVKALKVKKPKKKES